MTKKEPPTPFVDYFPLDQLPDFVIIQCLKRLPLHDLFNVARVNSRFAALAVSFHAAHTLNVSEYFTAKPNPTSGRHLVSSAQQMGEIATELVRYVGVHIERIVLDRRSLPYREFNCTRFLNDCHQHIGRRLRHLHVRGVRLLLSWDFYPELLFNLSSLHLEDCSSTVGYAGCAQPIVNYRTEMMFNDTDEAMPTATAMLAMRCLQTLSLIRCDHTLHTPQILQVIENNRQLEHVQIQHSNQSGSPELVPTMLRVLADYLHTVSLHHNTTHENSLLALAELPVLRTLQLVNFYQPTSGTMASRPLEDLLWAMRGNQTLRLLDLHHCRLCPDLYEVIATMQALRKLKMRKNYWMTDGCAARIGQHGRLVSIDCYDTINLTDAGLVRMVRGNLQLELLDASWVPQLTVASLLELKMVVNERVVAAAMARRSVRPLLVYLNGPNQIDWEQVKRDNVLQQVPEQLQVTADKRMQLNTREGMVFRVRYDNVLAGAHKEDWTVRYRGQVFEIN